MFCIHDSRYRSNLSAVRKIDEVFNIFIFGYFVLLFFGIVTEIEEVLSLFSAEEKPNVLDILLTIALVVLMLFSLFYTLKQTSDVNADSAEAKSLLYQYVLSTDPEDRTAVYYEEVYQSITVVIIIISIVLNGMFYLIIYYSSS